MTAPPTSPPARGLAETLTALAAVARAAGLDLAAARGEGERLAAAVAEAAPGAAADWNAATEHSDSQAFFEAASKGRRWRANPTALLSQLARDRSEHAEPYARALAEVCTSACALGTPTTRVVGNASLAAAAQLGALQAPVLVGSVESGSQLTQPHGSTFDLPSNGGWTPGAFPGLGSPTPFAPTPEPAGGTPPATQIGALASDAGPDAPAEPEPQTLVELLAELDALTGLTEVKAEIHRQVALLRIEGLRSEAGLRSATITRHLVFVGNPGTGKTTVARLVGGIYRALGLLSKGQLVEVDRSELVAGYLGQTAMKTSEVVASAMGGVLFIDEAYSLAGDQYGTEAVDTLVKEMEDHRDDLVLIVAGYPEPMAFFIAQNPGLASRSRTTIEFEDYSDPELVSIFTGMAANADYDLTEGCRTRFQTILSLTPRGSSFGNGRFARNHLEAAIGRHAWRLRDHDNPTVAELRELVADDLDDHAADAAESPLDAPAATGRDAEAASDPELSPAAPGEDRP